MRVLLTRPKESSADIAQLLRVRGHEVLLSPLIEIRFLEGSELPLDGVQALLATSGNGVRAAAVRTPRRDIPVFAVGAQTADAARAAGFMSVRHSDGDAVALAEAVAGWVTPDAGALLHIAGRDHNALLSQMLSRCGFKVRTEEIYEAVETPELSAEARDSVAAGTLDAVVLFSPRSATIFARQLRDAGLQSHCTTIAALCISAAAAEALAPLRFNGCYTAERPDQQSVIALVDTVARETAGRKN